MGPDLSNQFWTLPTVRQFLQEIGIEVRQGVNLILIYPPSISIASFLFALRDYLERERNQYVAMIDLSMMQEKTPFEVLKAHFTGLENDQYLEKSVDDDDLPDVIIISGEGLLTAERAKDWLSAMTRWANASAVSGSRHSLILCLSSSTVDFQHLPFSDIRLKYKTMAGFPSSLEMRLLCRMGLNETDAESQWSEYILSSIAGNDLQLVSVIWTEATKPFQKIKEALLRHSIIESITAEITTYFEEEWIPINRGVSLLPAPGDRNFFAISSGMTLYTVEFGEEIHPSILAFNNHDAEITHRIWRAQAALLLPMVDEYRRKVCDSLSERHGGFWAELDGEVLDPPIEMGELFTFFSNLPNSDRDKREFGSGVNLAWRIRNELAHYHPITFQEYLSFWNNSCKLNNQHRY